MGNELEELCKSLNLSHVARRVGEIEHDSKETFLINLLRHEISCREAAKIERFQKSAKFPSRKSLGGTNGTRTSSCRRQKRVSS